MPVRSQFHSQWIHQKATDFPKPGVSGVRWRELMTQAAPPSPPVPTKLLLQHLSQSYCGRHPAPFWAPLRAWQWSSACCPALPRPMPSSGSVSRNRQRGRPMTSRSFDGKIALLFGEERGLTSTMWRHLAEEWSTRRRESGAGGERRKRNGWCGIGLTEGIGKKTTFPRSLRGLKLGGEEGERKPDSGPQDRVRGCLWTRIPRVHCFRRLRAHCERGRWARLVPRLTQSSISQGLAAGVSGGRARASYRVRRSRRPPRLLGPLGLRLSLPFLPRRPLPPRFPAQSTWRRCCSRSWSARSWTSCLSPSRTNLRSSLLTSSPRSTAWRGGTRNLRWRAVSAALFPPLFLGPTPQRWLVSPCKLAVPTASLVASLLLSGHRRPSLNYTPSRFDTKELCCF